jgi:hypothetical protein
MGTITNAVITVNKVLAVRYELSEYKSSCATRQLVEIDIDTKRVWAIIVNYAQVPAKTHISYIGGFEGAIKQWSTNDKLAYYWLLVEYQIERGGQFEGMYV